jgi:hypothetical protein
MAVDVGPLPLPQEHCESLGDPTLKHNMAWPGRLTLFDAKDVIYPKTLKIFA